MQKKLIRFLEKYWIYFVYLLEFIIADAFNVAGNADLILKYWGASGMVSGLKLYTDLNFVVPPVSFLILYVPVMLVNSIYTVRIINIINWMIMFVLIHKIISKYTKDLLVTFWLNTMVICLLGTRGGFYYDYNFLAFTFMLAVIYILLNKKFNTGNAFLIAIFCTLIVWTKHSIGGIFFITTAVAILVYVKKEKDFWKNIAIMFATGIGISLIFLIYLWLKKSLYKFFDLLFLGVSDFKNNAMLQLEISDIFIIIMVVVLIVGLIKKRDRELVTLTIFAVPCLMFSYPIADYNHKVEFFIMLGIILQKIVAGEFSLKIKFLVPLSSVLAISLILVGSVKVTKNMIISENPVYKGMYIEPYLEGRLKELQKFIDSSDKEVYIIDKYASIYNVGLGRNMGYYDHLWNGNTGSESSLDYVKKLKGTESYVIIDTADSNAYQWDPEINKYVEENFEFVKNIGDMQLYFTER